jgi:replicative DNA helicase
MADDSIKKMKTGRTTRRGKAELSEFVFGKVQPQALPLEEAVLGALMLDKDALPIVLDILRPESFYSEAHKAIYQAMLDLFQHSQPVDLLTVTEELRKAGELETVGGPYYLVELTNRVASAANIEYHARIIAQKHIQRELIRVSTQVIQDAYKDTTDVFDLLDDAEKGLFAITQQNLSRGVESMGALATKALKLIESLKDKEDGLTGIPTGFASLDRLTSGWQRSDLIILAARPGMGKTSLVLAMARNAAMDFQKGVAVFSLEMSNVQLVQRLISLEAEITGSKLRNGQLQEYEWQQLHSAIEKLSEAPIYIDDTPGINIFELRAKSRRLKMQHDIQLIIIDYLQLMSGGSDNQRGNREQEVSAISRALKGMAKELDVPVIALSQLSRAVEVRGGTKRPQLSDLRESGCLTADTLIFNALTGDRVPIGELAKKNNWKDIEVLALNDQFKLESRPISNVFYSGDKKVFELKTRTGRTIKASANHPFLKLEGWSALEDLNVGDRIAVPRVLNTEYYIQKSTASYKTAVSRHLASKAAQTSTEIDLQPLAESDVLWDEIISITELGVEPVYDITVPGLHNFVAENIIVHNSIEQDADIVGFIYRPEYYQILEDEEGQSLKGIGEVIIAKHRNGALDTVKLRFIDQFAKFANLDEPNFDDLPGVTPFDTPDNNIITRPSRMNTDEDIPF